MIMMNMHVSMLNSFREKFHNNLKKKLNPMQTELILKIRSLFRAGIELFGDLDEFRNWLSKPAFGLGNHVPLDYFHTSGGLDLVFDELKRIEFGDLA